MQLLATLVVCFDNFCICLCFSACDRRFLGLPRHFDSALPVFCIYRCNKLAGIDAVKTYYSYVYSQYAM